MNVFNEERGGKLLSCTPTDISVCDGADVTAECMNDGIKEISDIDGIPSAEIIEEIDGGKKELKMQFVKRLFDFSEINKHIVTKCKEDISVFRSRRILFKSLEEPEDSEPFECNGILYKDGEINHDNPVEVFFLFESGNGEYPLITYGVSDDDT